MFPGCPRETQKSILFKGQKWLFEQIKPRGTLRGPERCPEQYFKDRVRRFKTLRVEKKLGREANCRRVTRRGTTIQNATFGKKLGRETNCRQVTRQGTTIQNATFGKKTRSRSEWQTEFRTKRYDDSKRYVWKKNSVEKQIAEEGHTTRSLARWITENRLRKVSENKKTESDPTGSLMR